jgi:hypothetical protein
LAETNPLAQKKINSAPAPAVMAGDKPCWSVAFIKKGCFLADKK